MKSPIKVFEDLGITLFPYEAELIGTDGEVVGRLNLEVHSSNRFDEEIKYEVCLEYVHFDPKTGIEAFSIEKNFPTTEKALKYVHDRIAKWEKYK